MQEFDRIHKMITCLYVAVDASVADDFLYETQKIEKEMARLLGRSGADIKSALIPITQAAQVSEFSAEIFEEDAGSINLDYSVSITLSIGELRDIVKLVSTNGG